MMNCVTAIRRVAAANMARLNILGCGRGLSSLSSSDTLYLGLDSSTQGLKVSAINSKMETVYNTAINFDAALPHYGTQGGFHQQEGTDVVTAPTLMFAEALDTILGSMKADDFPFHQVAAISGSGQQHGSVFFKNGARSTLQNLVAGSSIHEQLKDAFSTPNSPIWRDSSTTAQCKHLEAAVGGAQAMATITGSSAYERFTGNQILKCVQETPTTYQDTERISLISSFMCSILLGDYASIDSSDGAGMNMMDISTQTWSPQILSAIASDLEPKMGPIVPAHAVLGNVSKYLANEYGFSDKCKIVAWSGDNPNSVAGLGLRNPGDVGLSLGTSDTIFSIVDAKLSSPSTEGHMFMNPVDPNSHMAMLCYKNGSLARETVRNVVADSNWDLFNELVKSTPPGNNGNIGFFIDQPEIIPHISKSGIRRFDATGERVDSFAPAVEARAVVEGQMLSMRLHTAQLGLKPTMVIATGGGSANPVITQIMANVFGTSVLETNQTDSASLGAALRALHGAKCDEAGTFIPYAQVTEGCPAMVLHSVAEPDAQAHAIYTDMLAAYKQAEDKVVSE
eukprot:m.66531 g.66531  ORF g.66531 m.66531 type:complete len:566 (+) comp23700_c0_seq1:59-1756(+)